MVDSRPLPSVQAHTCQSKTFRLELLIASALRLSEKKRKEKKNYAGSEALPTSIKEKESQLSRVVFSTYQIPYLD